MPTKVSFGQPLPQTLFQASKPKYSRPSISSVQLLSATLASLCAFITLILITLQLSPYLTPAKTYNQPQVAGLSTQPLSSPKHQQSDFFIPTTAPLPKNPYTRTPPLQTETNPTIELD